MALLTLDQFVAKYKNKTVDVDKAYGPECWDLAEAYCEQVLGLKGNPYALVTGDGTAYGCFNVYPPQNRVNFLKVSRAYGPFNALKRPPKKGDLVFWDSRLPGSESSGHVAICLVDGGGSAFTSFDQNWGPVACHAIGHNYDHVAGYLRKK